MPKKKTPVPLRWQPIDVEDDGKKYDGKFAIDGRMIRVRMPMQSEKVTQLGASAGMPDVLAAMMLHEIIAEARRKGPL
jgi:hypothetical protein